MIKEINLLRMDVEGHEYAIIEGAHKILDQSKNCTIFMELHPWSLSELGKDPLFLLETLRDSGFKCIAVCGTEGNKPLIMPNWHYLISNLYNLRDHYGNKIFLRKN